MGVEIVIFPELKVAAIEYLGSPLEHDAVKKLIAWKLATRFLDPLKYRSYGVHYTDPRNITTTRHSTTGSAAFVGGFVYRSVEREITIYALGKNISCT